jgi:hypothetical protein
VLRNFLRQKIVEMDTEINRTDSLPFKSGLREIDTALERVLSELSAALDIPRPTSPAVRR